MKKVIIVIATTSLLTGCLTVPKTSTDLVETSSTTETFCYDIPNELIEKRVSNYLSRCYHPTEVIIPVGGLMVPMDASFQVVQEQLPIGKRFSVRNFVGFGLAVNITPNVKNCKTEVTMYGVSGMWRKNFTPIDMQAKGKQSECTI